MVGLDGSRASAGGSDVSLPAYRQNREGSSEPIPDIPAFESLSVSPEEAVTLGAVDDEFFCRTFFPRTYRMTSPEFSKEIWSCLNDPSKRQLNLQAFRGSAKTTRLRTFCLKRTAYRMSRTILFIGGSETKASQSIQWIRNQIDRNKLFTSVFGLERGTKWNDTEVEIRSRIDGTTTWILGVGSSASLRGINFDDYRPDLILGDDLQTDENVLTHESRQKLIDLLLGAVSKSLISRTEEPNAKIVVMQTPMHQEDATMTLAKASSWHTIRIGCWSKQTEDLPDHLKQSAWEEMFVTEDLKSDKMAHIEMNKLSVFLREMECRVTSPETSAFKIHNLSYYSEDPIGGVNCLSIDPVPPPTDVQIQKNLRGKDYEALVVQTRKGPNYYLREYEMERGHNPDWTITKTFELALRYRVQFITIDATAYQATLKWLLEKEMQRRGQYFVIIPFKNRQKKLHLITNAFAGILANRRYHVRKEHTDFVTQMSEYPTVAHDDLLDAAAMGLMTLVNPANEFLGDSSTITLDESEYEDLTIRRRAP